jgi:methyl-accepting chemotaxis protein
MNSLAAKAVLLVVSLCVATAVVLTGLAHLALRDDADALLTQDAIEASARAADVLAKVAQRVDTYATLFAGHPEVIGAMQSGDKARMREVFVRLYKQTNALDPVIGTMEVGNPAGIVVMRGHNPDQSGDDKSKEHLVRKALDGKPAGGLAVSPTSGEVAAEAVHPIMASGKLVGTLKIGSRFRASTAGEIKKMSGTEAILLYRGKVNASTIPDIKEVQVPPQLLASKTETAMLTLGGSSYQAAALSRPIEGAEPLVVLTLTDRAPAQARLFAFERGLVLQVLALLAFVVPVVVLLVRRGVRAIEDLTGTMRGLAGGDLDTAIPHRARKDEIGAMAAAIGVFKDNALQVRALEAQEKASATERLARAEAMAGVVAEVGAAVARAVEGDFSARLACDTASDDLRRLIESVNEINRVVDGATGDFAAVLDALAQGDLTRSVTTSYKGRFGELKDAINETIARLAETVSTIQATAGQVGSSAREITSGADDLSHRTEEQASSLEETAATTEELAASVKASAAASRQSVKLATDTTQVAERGGSIVTEAVEAMARIEQSSRKISEITSVIDEIAFQTNLLALNAAVEAARAGDAGKGFAVVASEVRTLAQRSSDAAKDIKGLIGASGNEVAQGVALVHSAGEALSQIVTAARSLAGTVSDIASAAAEQANGIDEMSQTVAHMDEMTQQNAALAEESAAAATTLAQQIERMNQLVAGFRTQGGGHDTALARAA